MSAGLVIAVRGNAYNIHPKIHASSVLIRSSKKTRCNGRQPCLICTRVGVPCKFTASYTRGRLPQIPTEDENLTGSGNDQTASSLASQITPRSNQEVPARNDHHSRFPLDSGLEEHMPTSAHPNGILAAQRQPSNHERATSRVESSRNSPEPPQTDLQGHIVGPSSGVSFLLRVQKKLHQKISFSQNTSIFTFGDAPLPEFDPSFLVLPPKAEAEMLVARYFDFAIATHRFLHRPTVEGWLEDFYDGLGVTKQKDGAKERTALLFMVFAQATEHLPGDERPNGVDTR